MEMADFKSDFNIFIKSFILSKLRIFVNITCNTYHSLRLKEPLNNVWYPQSALVNVVDYALNSLSLEKSRAQQYVV